MLVRSERLAAVGEMASAVGHELRNPLGTITNSLYLARMALGPGVDPDVERHLQLAERETARAVNITDELRAYVRPRVAVAAPVDLASLVTEVLESLAPAEGVDLQVQLAPVHPLADREHLAEVLANLVENAYQAMPQGGALHIVSGEDHGRVVLTVTDTGDGMDEQLMSKVFEPFFTTRAQGTGLGLAIVQRLVEQQGGTIGVRSTPGGGARFTVRLPAATGAPHGGVAPEPGPAPAPGPGQRHGDVHTA